MTGPPRRMLTVATKTASTLIASALAYFRCRRYMNRTPIFLIDCPGLGAFRSGPEEPLYVDPTTYLDA